MLLSCHVLKNNGPWWPWTKNLWKHELKQIFHIFHLFCQMFCHSYRKITNRPSAVPLDASQYLSECSSCHTSSTLEKHSCDILWLPIFFAFFQPSSDAKGKAVLPLQGYFFFFLGENGVWTHRFIFSKQALYYFKPHFQSISVWLLWRLGFLNCLPGLALNHNPSASQVLRIAGISYWSLARDIFLSNQSDSYSKAM
jgi:hypothetical protein